MPLMMTFSLIRYFDVLYYYPGLRPPLLKKKGNFGGPHGCADKENIAHQLINSDRKAYVFGCNKCQHALSAK
jgi:hypothetical protein